MPIAVAPRTAYPEEYAPLRVMTATYGKKVVYRDIIRLTLGHVPAQVPESIPGVVSEGRSEDSLSSIFNCVRHARNELDNVRRRESFGSYKVTDEVAIHYYGRS